MELKTWLRVNHPAAGICRYCGTRYADVPGESAPPATEGGNGEIPWAQNPCFLVLEGGLLSTPTGEWCGWECLEADFSSFFELRAIGAELDRLLAEARALPGDEGPSRAPGVTS